MKVISGIKAGPFMGLIYGTPGVGKSELAATALKALMIDVGGDIDRIDADKTPKINSLAELNEALRFAYKSDYKSVVIDQTSAVEDLITQELLAESGNESLADFGFGKGYALLKSKWLEILNVLKKLKEAGKNVILVGHDEIQTFQNPSGDDYDHYTLKLQKKARASVFEACDFIFFMCWEKNLQKDNDQSKAKAKGTGTRVVYTKEMPSYIAKNRYSLPPKLEIEENGKDFLTQLQKTVNGG